jgi:hypothetical protein
MTDDRLEAAVDDAMAAVIAWQKQAREALWASPSRNQVRETIRAQWERAEAAEAKLAAERERLASRMDDLAANYPGAVFPPDSDVRDSIGATAMRLAYLNAARIVRETQDRSDEKEAGAS